jgi:hypothetical protein
MMCSNKFPRQCSWVFTASLIASFVLKALPPVLAQGYYSYPNPKTLGDSIHNRQYCIVRWDTALDSAQQKAIEDFVTRESIRFKKALHPIYSKIDSLYPDAESKRMYEMNPLLPFLPRTRGYHYAPRYRIRNLDIGMERKVILLNRNYFEVTRYDHFIRPADKSKGIKADTIRYNGDIERLVNTIFNNFDHQYAVFYCPPNAELYMLGGNAFLQQRMPLGALECWLPGSEGNEHPGTLQNHAA